MWYKDLNRWNIFKKIKSIILSVWFYNKNYWFDICNYCLWVNICNILLDEVDIFNIV